MSTAPSVPPASDQDAAHFDRRSAELAPLYELMRQTLIWGFRLSAALFVVGILLSLIRDEPLAEEAQSLDEIASLLRDGHGSGFLDLAIVAIVLTPIASVIVLTLGFYRLGDRRYALYTLVVLAILGVSVTLSLLR